MSRQALISQSSWRVASMEGARIAAVGICALTIAFKASSVTWSLNVYWFCLLLLIVLVGGVASARRRAATAFAEGLLAIVVLQSAWPILWPQPVHFEEAEQPNSIGWVLSFTGDGQALRKTLALPPDWQHFRTYVRIDLGRHYEGVAGLRLEVNGEMVGEVSHQSQEGSPWYLGGGSARWVYPIPRHLLERGSWAEVTLRPTVLDPNLSIAGHGDPLVEPLGKMNSQFFDGVRWHNDHLAGTSGHSAVGTYRIWLVTDIGQRE